MQGWNVGKRGNAVVEEDHRHRSGLWSRRIRRRSWRRAALLGLAVLVVLAGSAHWLRHKLVRKHLARTLPMPTVPPASPYPDPPGIVLHDSDSPAVVHGIPINAANLERIHKRDHPHWATTFEGKTYHIAYHYVILPDGKIEKGRPDHCVGAHARTHNDWLGICVVGAFSANNNPHWWPQTPTPAEVRSTVTLCEELMSKYHIPPERVKRHRDLNDTYCPGGRFPYFAILAQLQAYASTHPETRPLTNRVVSLAHPPPPGRKRRLKRMRDEG